MVRLTLLLIQDREGSGYVQALVLVSLLGLGGVAATTRLREALDSRAACAATQIVALNGAAPCTAGPVAPPSAPTVERSDPGSPGRSDLATLVGPEREAQLDDFDRRERETADKIDRTLTQLREVIDQLRDSSAPDAIIEDLEELEGKLEGLQGESEATGEKRQFLSFSANSGDHRLVEVVGDLETADRVIIHVPGMNNELGDYADGGHDAASNVFRQVQKETDENIAVISFMDYNVPDDPLEAASSEGARSGVEPLQALVADLHSLGLSRDQIVVAAHSYGSVVTGHAMVAGLDVGTVVTVGSPGMGYGVDDRSKLGSPHIKLYSAAAGSDLIPYAPAHGESPADDGFGSTVFDVGDISGHGEYFNDETRSLINIARIAAGKPPL